MLAYHDRADGGLLATLAEMSFAGHVGVTARLGDIGGKLLPVLFNEELGAVLQVRHCETDTVLEGSAKQVWRIARMSLANSMTATNWY